jgi:hypothetical protein
MTEYTSLEVSKRLAAAGFDAPADGTWMMRCDARQQYRKPRLWEKHTLVGLEKNDKGVLAPIPYVSAGDRLGYAYRSDTLLAWLMKKDAGKVAEAMGVRTLCENGRYGCIQIDVLDNGDWNVSLFRPIEVRVTAPTLPDSLAEVILRVLEVSK